MSEYYGGGISRNEYKIRGAKLKARQSKFVKNPLSSNPYDVRLLAKQRPYDEIYDAYGDRRVKNIAKYDRYGFTIEPKTTQPTLKKNFLKLSTIKESDLENDNEDKRKSFVRKTDFKKASSGITLSKLKGIEQAKINALLVKPSSKVDGEIKPSIKKKIEKIKGLSKARENEVRFDDTGDMMGFYTKTRGKRTVKKGVTLKEPDGTSFETSYPAVSNTKVNAMVTFDMKKRKQWLVPSPDKRLLIPYTKDITMPRSQIFTTYAKMGIDPKQSFPYKQITAERALEDFKTLKDMNVDLAKPAESSMGNATTDRFTQVLRSKVKLVNETESQLDVWENLDRRARLIIAMYELNRKDLATNYNTFKEESVGTILVKAKDMKGKANELKKKNLLMWKHRKNIKNKKNKTNINKIPDEQEIEVEDTIYVPDKQYYDLKTMKVNWKDLMKRDSTIRGALQMNVGSNNQFKPYVAKWLYNRFKKDIDIGILDTSAGWGGRMVGALAMDMNYIGSDYNAKLIPAYKEIYELLKNDTTSQIEVSQADAGAIDYSKLKGKYDYYFSSPPYMKGEKQIEKYENMKDYDSMTFYTELLIPAFKGMIKYLPINKYFCYNIPIENHEKLARLLLGQPLHKIALAKKSRAGEDKGEGGAKEYKEFIYVYQKTANYEKEILEREKSNVDEIREHMEKRKDAVLKATLTKAIDKKVGSSSSSNVETNTTHTVLNKDIFASKFDVLPPTIYEKKKSDKKIFDLPSTSPTTSPVLPRKLLGFTPTKLGKITEDKREIPLSQRRAEGYRTKGDLAKMGISRADYEGSSKLTPNIFSASSSPEQIAGEGFNFITNHIDDDELEGGNLRDAMKGERTDYPPKVYEFLLKNGNRQITGIKVFRQPLAKALTTAMNFMSLGKWNSQSKKHGYDTFYHLGMILTLDNKDTVMCQKNEVIDMGFRSMPPNITTLGGGVMDVEMNSPIQLNKFMLEGAKVLGNKWYSYNPFSNNCQVFVWVALRSNRLITPKLKDFIYQKVGDIVEKQSGFFKTITPAVTKIGALFNRLTQGDVRDKSKYVDVTHPENKHDQTKDYPTHTMPNGVEHTEEEHNEYSVPTGNEDKTMMMDAEEDLSGGDLDMAKYDTHLDHQSPDINLGVPHNLPHIIYINDLDY